ncbi:MAG: M64 family metallopeptidase [Acetivibrio ethanolgignens]
MKGNRKRIVIFILVICMLQVNLFSAMPLQIKAAERHELNLGETALGSEIHWQTGDSITGGLGSYAYGTDASSSTVQPIVWKVLDTKTNMDGAIEKDGLFLVSKNVLDWTLWNEFEIRNGKYYKSGASTFANAWEGSTAQAWCRGFYENTIRKSTGGEKVLETTKTDEPITLSNCWNGNTYSYGAGTITNERVFFLSVRETENYFKKDAERAALGAVVYYWTRSPHDTAGNDPRACYIHNDGTRGRHMGVDPYGARPALNLDYKDLLFQKVADGSYKIVTEEEAKNPVADVEPGVGGAPDFSTGDNVDTDGNAGKGFIEVNGVKVEVETIQKNGPDNENIVWIIAGDGYTESELRTFRVRINELLGYFFKIEPYKQFQDKINIYALKTISQISGLGAGKGGGNDTVFGIHQSWGALCDIGDNGLEFFRLSSEALKESFLDPGAEITSYQIISNSNVYCGAGYMNGNLSMFTVNGWFTEMAVHEMGHTHGLTDEYDSNSSGVNAAYKQKGVRPDVDNLSWRKFLGYKGVGAYEKPSNPQVTPKYNCMMNFYAEYCPVCKAYVFNVLNHKLDKKRIMLYQDDIEITTAEEPGYIFDGGNIYDVHSNYEGTKINTIGSENITEANGKRLEARTIVRSYAKEPQYYELKLEIKGQDGRVKHMAKKTFTLLWNELESISVVTEELHGLVAGDTIDATLKRVAEKPVLPAATVTQEPMALTDLVYNGKAQRLVKAGAAEGGQIQYRVGAGAYQDELPTGTDAAAYTVYYKVVGDAAHSDSAEKSFTVFIAPKEITVAPKSCTIDQGSAIPAFELIYTGLVGTDRPTPKVAPGFLCKENNGVTDVSPSTAAGTYTIVWHNQGETTFTGAENYKVVKASTATLTINAVTPPTTGGGGEMVPPTSGGGGEMVPPTSGGGGMMPTPPTEPEAKTPTISTGEEHKDTTGAGGLQKVYDKEGRLAYQVKVNTADIKADTTLYVYKYDTKTKKYQLVKEEDQRVNVDADGSISYDFDKLAFTQRYELVTKEQAAAIDKKILATVKVKYSNKTVKQNTSVKFIMDQGLNMDNVKSIQYTSANKKVAAVSKSGKITAKNAGKVTVKAKVTLLNGKSKTVKMTITVK